MDKVLLLDKSSLFVTPAEPGVQYFSGVRRDGARMPDRVRHDNDWPLYLRGGRQQPEGKTGRVLKIGDRVVTVIGDVAFGGDGVGRVSDLVVFVPFTVEGDEAEVEITEVKRRYARGRLVRIVTPSGHRVAPPCPYYARCGGCRMQHIAYAHQLGIKGRQVEQTFRRIAKGSLPSVLPVIPSPRPTGYRGKAEFHLAGRRGGRRAGLMALASNVLVQVERCGICDNSINRKLGELRERLLTPDVPIPGDRQIIWSDEPGEPPAEVATGPGKGPDVTRIVRGKRLAVPYEGFFQANISLVGELVDQVVAMCALSGGETIVDAYGGAGLFSLFLGERAGRLFGIEGEREAVRCARINLRREGLGQAEFFLGDVGAVLDQEFLRRRMKVDVVVADPPRDGCGAEVIERMSAIGPGRIVYVSCNPATQARDIRLLSECGYVLRRLQPIDMFPQTAHIEVVALLTKDE
jgi:23S rRNA (uracil1939-C5)-methyltransferase